MRGKDPQGRFDTQFEVFSIYEGISEDLQVPVGQEVDWWVYDSVNTVGDPIYDVGNSVSGGRQFKTPVSIPVVGASIVQGQFFDNDRGFYTSDNLRLIVAVDVMDDIIPGFSLKPDVHLKDRLVYRNEVFTPTLIYPKGHIHQHLTVITIQADQVNTEQLVNDPQFANYL
jgi:hypothetical protein